MPYDKKCLSIDLLFEGGRMSVGAISVAYLLSMGVSVEKVAYLKIIQGVVLLFGEIPTGVFADAFGSRRSLHAACVSSILGFLIYATSSSFLGFCVGEVFLALALCFWSGAYEAFAIDTCKLDDKSQPGLLDRFFHLNQSLNGLSVLVMGWVGGFIGSRNLHFPYFLAIAMMIIASITLLKVPQPSDDTRSRKKPVTANWVRQIESQARETWEQITQMPALVPFFVANILIQFSIQPLLHYWQPFFQARITDDAPSILGTIFAAYCASSIVCSFVFSKLSRLPSMRSNYTTLGLFLIFSTLYVLFANATTFTTSVIYFVAMQGILSVARTQLSIRLNEIIPSNHRAALLSTVSLVSRLGMMGALASIGQYLGKSQDPRMLTNLMHIFGVLSSAVVILLFVGFIFNYLRTLKQRSQT